MVNSSPAVAAHAEGEEIEVLESTDVLPVAPVDVSDNVQMMYVVEKQQRTEINFRLGHLFISYISVFIPLSSLFFCLTQMLLSAMEVSF